MSMTHPPETGAENAHQKTGTINRHENRTLSYSNRKLIPEYFGTKLHVRGAGNHTGILVPVFGADFWYVCHWHKVRMGKTYWF